MKKRYNVKHGFTAIEEQLFNTFVIVLKHSMTIYVHVKQVFVLLTPYIHKQKSKYQFFP